MKTPIQELIEQLKEERDGFLKLPPHSGARPENCFGSCIKIAERMLKKEKEVISSAFHADRPSLSCYDDGRAFEEYYNETFNTKEK